MMIIMRLIGLFQSFLYKGAEVQMDINVQSQTSHLGHPRWDIASYCTSDLESTIAIVILAHS